MMVYAVFILPIIMLGSCKSESFSVKFRQISDVILPASTIATTEQTRVGCCKLCTELASCNAALYYPSSQVCEFTSLQLLISPATSSPAGSLYVKGTIYKLVKNMWSWYGAKNNCEVDGGHLVKIESSEEHTQLLSWLQEYGHSSGPTSHMGPWIGLNDLEQEGDFTWQDGSPLVDFTPWLMNNPSNTGENEHCVHLYMSFSMEWNDLDCSYRSWSICEYN